MTGMYPIETLVSSPTGVACAMRLGKVAAGVAAAPGSGSQELRVWAARAEAPGNPTTRAADSRASANIKRTVRIFYPRKERQKGTLVVHPQRRGGKSSSRGNHALL